MADRVKEAVRTLLAEVAGNLPPERVDAMESLISAGEEGVALEILVDNVIDDDLSVSAGFKSSALDIAEAMRLEGNRWEYLARLR